MRFRTAILAACLVMLAAGAVSAQTTMTWRMQVYQNGVDPVVGSPFYTLDLPAAIVTCNTTQVMPTTPTTPPVNPKTIWWIQDELPGQVCKGDLSGQTAFIALPSGGPYPFSLVAVNEVGASVPKAGLDPFRRVDLAHAPAVVLLK